MEEMINGQLMKFVLISIGLAIVLNSNAQISTPTSINTPKGSSVPDAYTTTELSAPVIAGINYYTDITYPLATRISDASSTYNCHGYVWHMTEGGGAVEISSSKIYILDRHKLY